MAKKGRFCNMGPAPGVDFCGVHVAEVAALGGVAPVPTTRTSEGRVEGEKGLGHGAVASKHFLTSAAATAAAVVAAASESAAVSAGYHDEGKGKKGRDWRDKGRRIPCPHDPRHSIYEKDLQHHLNNCPMFKQKQAVEAQPFYSENINMGAAGVREELDDDDAEAEEERLRKGEELPKFKTLLADLQAEVDMRAFSALVHEVYGKVVGDIPTEVLLPTSLSRPQAPGGAGLVVAAGGDEDSETKKDTSSAGGQEVVGRRKWNSGRHEEQQRSILGHMQQAGLLAPNFVYVEMGAGRGTLSRTLREAEPSSDVVLVERGSQRNRVDPKMTDKDSAGVRIWASVLSLDCASCPCSRYGRRELTLPLNGDSRVRRRRGSLGHL